ncbi:SH2 domain-containing adapter protein F [Pseudolycoriella hygida]|uniref:SH2 domain-containing adapter protein D n=1 Tax=Pseudolycoriella hygida TaxID=35572 RepID=A0A9Q0RXA8_9DIPT|nr:SH2 domain-containing adapter protein F [Pseudolycoriella hygida]
MERMWRRMNQGLTKPSKSKGQRPIPVPVNSNDNFPELEQSQSAKILLDKRRKRCRKGKPRARSKSSSKTTKKVEFPIPSGSKDPSSLKERAVAKLKMLNFNLNWTSNTMCRPCRSNINGNIITRRLCRNKQMDDNELYRSNSFKFEKFKRDEVILNSNTLPRPISVCDDYSLPIDFVYNRQLSNVSPKSVCLKQDVVLVPEVASVKNLIVHPKPVKATVKDYVNLRKHESNSDSSLPKSSDDEIYENSERDSPESKTDDLTNLFKLNPSPYYYGDIFGIPKSEKSAFQPFDQAVRYKQNTSNFLPQRKKTSYPRRYSVTEDGVHIIKCVSPSTTSDDSNCTECQKRREGKQSLVATPNSTQSELLPMPPHRLLEPILCACTGPEYSNDFADVLQSRSVFYVHEPNVNECADCCLNDSALPYDDTMPNGRSRQVYETAFDCKISRSDDDLDELNTVLSKSLILKNKFKASKSTDSLEFHEILHPEENPAKRTVDVNTQKPSNSIFDNRITENDDEASNRNSDALLSSTQLPIPNRFKQSPPSTAPLPLKFPRKYDTDHCLNSNKSAPNIPQSNTLHNYNAGDGKSKEPITKEAIVNRILSKQRSSGNKTKRPCSMILESERVLALKHSRCPLRYHHKPKNFSSTESITTSSSGGSMESLRSSTSEGNRSTTSSESRHSSTLSSHSSDSGAKVRYPPRLNMMLHSKLHVLSPISDKSLQDPTSEIGENSAVVEKTSKISPQGHRDFDHFKSKKFPQNRALTLLAGDEIQGSDSGISLQSRDGSKSKHIFHSFDSPKLLGNKLAINKSDLSLCEEFGNLPFDMPKLRRKKIAMEQSQCASGSATSVDLGDLPFDMPKLRRKLRQNNQNHLLPINNAAASTESSELSLSTQSVRGEKKPIGSFKQNLTLQFQPNHSKDGNEKGLHLNFETATTSYPVINIDIPLNRQSWYHGSITRIEAENTLRSLSEGSFLVRNCESSRNDFSLSLKSAKGFMHMRIQQNDYGQFILGHFSQPFESISIMIRHFCLNRLPVRGAEHMCLLEPVAAQLL